MRFDIAAPGRAYSAADKSHPKTDYDTREVITDEDGNRIFQLPVLFLDDGRTETMSVSVRAKEDPYAKWEPMTPLSFKGLSVSVGVFNGRKFYSLGADSVSKA